MKKINMIAKLKQVNRKRYNFCWQKCMLFVSVAVFLISLVSQLFFTNTLAVKSKQLVELEYKKDALSREISELHLEKSKYSSLSYIESRAHELGFTPNDKYVSTIDSVNTTASAATY